MAKWDAAKNKVIVEKKIKASATRVIQVSGSCYDGGEPEISVCEFNTDRNGKTWPSLLKRMDLALAKKVGIAIKKMSIQLLEDEV
jgi:hypothetical protein